VRDGERGKQEEEELNSDGKTAEWKVRNPRHKGRRDRDLWLQREKIAPEKENRVKGFGRKTTGVDFRAKWGSITSPRATLSSLERKVIGKLRSYLKKRGGECIGNAYTKMEAGARILGGCWGKKKRI